ncbi:MAG: alpha/beta hydrolase [Lachnospiraceae bacterium]|nr:alpha/beta hydrolase [Lachnospiraceae bacterium]
MKKNQLRGKRIISSKVVLIGIVVLVLLVLTGFKVYVDNGYKAIHELDYFKLTEPVTVSETDNLISVLPVSKSDKNVGLIFYGGERINKECYYPLMMELAAKGYYCYLPTTFGNLPILNIEGAEFVIRKYPDIKEWYIIAHSQSCEIAAKYAKGHTKSLTGLVYLGGYSLKHDLSPFDLKLLSIHGSRDTVFNLELFKKAKQNDPKNSTYQVINGGNNTGFADCRILKKDTEATINIREQVQETAKMIDEFINNSKEEK